MSGLVDPGSENETPGFHAPLVFGAFRLDVRARRLTERGRPVPIGDRALELLIALAERPGEVASKSTLLRRVWPNTHVDEANLRVQVAALRRALGQGGERYVVNALGRGYSFVAPIEPWGVRHQSVERRRPWPSSGEPVGREAEIAGVLGRIDEARLLTIVGPGGIGKTTLALACSRDLEARNTDGVAFVETSGGADLTMTIAASLGVRLPDDDGLAALSAYLAPLELLLVLDGCEYALEAVARTVETILRQAPNVTILATSREPIRAEFEVIWRIEPLATPPLDAMLSAAEAFEYGAVRLFVDRAAASDRSFRLSDEAAMLIASICRRLDGLPLAIELAAGRIGALGLAGIEAGLDNRFQILGEGRRTATPRHRTMVAAIDWSYFALEAEEQRALRWLSLFQSPFLATAAAHLLVGEEASPGAAIEVLSSLVAKSLVVANTHVTPVEYRLLDTTREYARAKLEAADEVRLAGARHAAHSARAVATAEAQLDGRPMRDWLDHFARALEDVGAALDWACSTVGDRSFAVPLTIAAIPVWIRLNRIEETRRRIEAALAIVEPDTADEMALVSALANMLQEQAAPMPDAEAPCHRAISLARTLQDAHAGLRSQWTLWRIHISHGFVAVAQRDVARYRALISGRGRPFERVVADRMVAVTELVAGDLAAARDAVDRVLAASAAMDARERLKWYAYDPDVLTRNMLVSLLWLGGRPETALSVAEENFATALVGGNDPTTCAVLTDAICPLALDLGDLELAERYLARLDDMVVRGAASSFRQWATVFRATLAAVRGDPQPGLTLLAKGLPPDAAHPRYSSTLVELAFALGEAGHRRIGRRLADDLLRRFEERGERWIWSEIQRVRGELCDDPQTAEALFLEAMEVAQAQGAKAWALRAAMSLARLRSDRAHETLAPCVASYTEGHETKDLVAAREALRAGGATPVN